MKHNLQRLTSIDTGEWLHSAVVAWQN